MGEGERTRKNKREGREEGERGRRGKGEEGEREGREEAGGRGRGDILNQFVHEIMETPWDAPRPDWCTGPCERVVLAAVTAPHLASLSLSDIHPGLSSIVPEDSTGVGGTGREERGKLLQYMLEVERLCIPFHAIIHTQRHCILYCATADMSTPHPRARTI